MSTMVTRVQSMNEVATLSQDVARVRALGIIIVTLNIEQNAGNASGNVNVSYYLREYVV